MYDKILKNTYFGVLFTKFIIFDLEFNSTKIPNQNKNINEIIEIGAVKLNEKLKEIDHFSMTVRPKYTKKLNPYTKKITHITEEELNKSKDFSSVIELFKNWCGDKDDLVFLSWSDTDLHVIAENYIEFLDIEMVDFIKKYTDLQKYISNFIKTENNNQISLKTAAEFYKINTDRFSLHRAMDDSRVCGAMLFKSYNKKLFKKYIREINDKSFYKRLLFKSYSINNLKDKSIKPEMLLFNCPVCENQLKFNGKFSKNKNAFTENIKCDKCKKNIGVTIKIKMTFDGIKTNVFAREIKKSTNKSAKK